MKHTLNVYFDYICPYCYRGIMDLLNLLLAYPELQVEWIPCESHPWPETAYVSSSLASQAMYAAAKQGVDLIPFHQAVFSAHFKERRRIDDISVLSDIAASCGADRDKILSALKTGLYRQTVLDNNRLVWDTLKFEAVPDYQVKSRILASQEDVMISKNTLEAFLNSIITE